MMEMKTKALLMILFCTSLVSCKASNPPKMSEGHISVEEKSPSTIPAIVKDAPALPRPVKRENLETYTVIVSEVPVRELLFSIARDAKLNIDIDNDISGMVTMNAIDQTLPRILDRLARQVDINYKLIDGALHVKRDTPYLQTYDISYLNMSRESTGAVTVSTEISSTGGGADGSAGGSGGGNDSSTKVENVSNNNLWATLTGNIASIIGEESTVTDNKTETSTNIIINRESGKIAVRATNRQHEQIAEFIDNVMGSAQRQVLIEATIAEVTLSNSYQSGIDWSVVSASSSTTNTLTQSLLGGNLGNAPFFSYSFDDSPNGAEPVNVTLKALETFGDVKVLSSPKIMALNNQTSMLKVVDNEVYFTTDVEVSQGTSVGGVATALAVISTEVNTVPVGFVMSVTPFIDGHDVVTLNVRPTISRIINTVSDPNPALADADVTSEIPVVQVREIESVLKVNNGDTAVIGGLMQDQINQRESGVPLLSSIPILGKLFSYTDDEFVKTELVIFIRPVVVKDASLTGDLKEYRKYLEGGI